jgi:glycosyltransferase involved in cell wall biosynthesis
LITLICTVLNEGESIRPLMDSIAAQTRLPDEIVFVDGGSQDHTTAVIESYADKLPIRVIVEPGCNISAGRNVAIQAAQGDVIAAVDAGVLLSPNWFESITRPFDDPQVEVVAGFFQADPHTIFEAAMGATVLPLADEIAPATFLPSSRSVAFRKSAWERIGGYPEWIDYCEDLIFDLRLKATARPFVFVPEALVYFRPRGSMNAYFKQYYRYARGDGKVDLWRKRHAIRYMTYLVAAPVILLLGLLIDPLLWLLYIPGAVVYFQRPYRRLPAVLKHAPSMSILGLLYALALIPVIRVVGDVAKMIGYPVGLRWRRMHQPPDWRISTLSKS